ncbi:low molecular weight protein-tyrosine-phosphatase [Rurimicrobium arvi]|uniref:protein-tyrosine-phosphatase n=1 Tax=Rurimicrobium arvi TaxID=2049916 RepID=A0ABP8ML92_9BACT
MKILMVCLGNICRSPIAEGVLRAKAKAAGLDWQIDSAGTNRYHIGEAPHRFSQKVCRNYGIDISQQRARRITAADLEQYDIIYALAQDVYDDICAIAGTHAPMDKVRFLLEELHEDGSRDVPDPWYGNEDGYLPVYQLIEEACDAIVRKYGNAPRN